jgi:D-amino peptidase
VAGLSSDNRGRFRQRRSVVSLSPHRTDSLDCPIVRTYNIDIANTIVPNIEGSDAMILLGYHAMALTPNGTLAHSFSSASIQGMWLNGREVGEIGVDAAIAAEYKVPVVMVSGVDKCCAEARSWLPGVVTCQTKVGTGPQSADVLPLEESRRLITQKTKEALAKRKEIRPIKTDYPATIRWDYLPKGSPRTHNPAFKPVDDRRRVDKTGEFR